ncbi:MAG: hypothetical protein HY920_02980 [Elusimicrobia bacterium]|nr:hypothetical protein [Elusimicrobiota bacterium]
MKKRNLQKPLAALLTKSLLLKLMGIYVTNVPGCFGIAFDQRFENLDFMILKNPDQLEQCGKCGFFVRCWTLVRTRLEYERWQIDKLRWEIEKPTRRY